MKASEKFEARLKELNLWDEWVKIGEVGRVAKFNDCKEIILLIHEDDSDKYSEIQYPSFADLRDNPVFVRRCVDEFLSDMDRNIVECADDQFQFRTSLAAWLRGRPVECPLAPVDVYFPADGMSDYYEDFEDDDDEDEYERKEREYQTFIEQTQDFCVWMEYSLGIMRKKLIEAINVELDRGHNVGHDFRIEDDYSYFRDFYMDNVSYEEVVRENGLLTLDCVTMSGPNTDELKETERFSLPLTFLSEQDLLKIYEQMK